MCLSTNVIGLIVNLLDMLSVIKCRSTWQHESVILGRWRRRQQPRRYKLSVQSTLCSQRFALFMWFLYEKPTAVAAAALTACNTDLLHRLQVIRHCCAFSLFLSFFLAVIVLLTFFRHLLFIYLIFAFVGIVLHCFESCLAEINPFRCSDKLALVADYNELLCVVLCVRLIRTLDFITFIFNTLSRCRSFSR